MNKVALINELQLVLQYYNLPKADFCWSHYGSSKDAIADLERIILAIENDDVGALDDIALLFAPTGSIQEIAISSGWGNEYIEISARIDRLLKSNTTAPI